MLQPAQFEGTDEERRANYASHYFFANDPDEIPRCIDCDCRPGGLAAWWPCGMNAPTVAQVIDEAGDVKYVPMTITEFMSKTTEAKGIPA